MKQNKIWIGLFILPTLLLFLAVFGISIVILLYTSFTNWRIGGSMDLIGLRNYVELITADKNFLRATLNTVIWIVLQATLHVSIGVILSLILSRKKFYWKFTRTVYMIPNIISSAALGMLFMILLNPQFGAVNSFIRSIGFPDFNQNWFMGKSTAFLAVTITWLPYAATVTILLLAEIAAIDTSIFESAKVDGATEFQTIIGITLPMLRNIIGTSAVLAGTSMLQKLDILMMTTRGGPMNTTLNLPLYIYQTALTDNNFSRANTAGVYLILLGLVTVLILSKAFRIGKETY